MEKKSYDFDVALSFAGEDRAVAEALARELRDQGVRVFYDRYEQAELWGKDLYQHLQTVYRDKARYCVVFISRHYAGKVWTRHELKQAQARAFQESREYILPLLLDDTQLPGLNATIGYLDLREHDVPFVRNLVLAKLNVSPSGNVTHPIATEAVSEDDEPELLDLRVDMDSAFKRAMGAIAEITNLSTQSAAADLEWKTAAETHAASGSRDPQRAHSLINFESERFRETIEVAEDDRHTVSSRNRRIL